jgi:hypothetical protein
MKLTASIASIVLTPVIFLLASCGGGGGSSSSAVDAGAPVSVAGSEIVFNPRIKFLDETNFEYDNTLATNSDFPAGVVTGTYLTDLNKASRKLTLTLTETGTSKFGGTPLELILSGCKDEEGDGLIDSFSYTASHGAVQKTGGGIFTGGKPANPDASSSNVADVSGAPTKAEWEKYVIGKNIVEIDEEGDYGYWKITDSSNYEAAYQAPGASISVNGTYTYEKTSENTGNFTFKDSAWNGTVSVTFVDFFSGTYTGETNVPVSGEWRIFSDVSILE